MKNWFLLLILVAAAGWAFQGRAADCRASLLTESFSPIRSFTIDTDEYEIRNYGRDHLAWAIKIVRLVLDEQGCAPDDVNFGRGSFGRSKSRCSLVSAPKE